MGVLVVEYRPMLRAAISALLKLDPKVRVVGECCGQEAAATIEQLQPELVVVGVEASKDLEIGKKGGEKGPWMLAFIMRVDAELVAEAVAAGFEGVVLNSSPASELPAALRAVRSGQGYISAETGELLSSRRDNGRVPPAKLSAREREVLALLSEGHPTKQIAGMLSLSAKTIETHRLRIMRKLKLYSVAELTKYAIRNGLTRV
jgi:DNA-binding NarL/FixJ family response regulator